MKKIPFLLLILLGAFLCQADSCQTDQSSEAVQIDSTKYLQKIDSLTIERNQLLGTLRFYTDSITKGSFVRVTSIREDFFNRMNYDAINSSLDTISKTFPEGKIVYSTNTPIKGIFPPRNGSSYYINNNQLTLTDPVAFWKYYRFCMVLTDSTYYQYP